MQKTLQKHQHEENYCEILKDCKFNKAQDRKTKKIVLRGLHNSVNGVSDLQIGSLRDPPHNAETSQVRTLQ